jgi:hypothetical protein
MIIAGRGTRQALVANPDMSKIMSFVAERSDVVIPRDDWPYLYIEHRGIPRLYLITLLMLLCVSIVVVFIFSPLRLSRVDPLLFLLGCGFLLLETKAVTTFSLLFGSTWLVNAVVFSAILAIGLAANIFVMAKQLKGAKWAFGGLLVSLLLLYFLPTAVLLKYGLGVKIFIAGVLSAIPVFFSSVAFAVILKKAGDVGNALGSNLLGAVAGGFFEYSSMALGLKALYIAAFCFYAIAAMFYIATIKSRVLGCMSP